MKKKMLLGAAFLLLIKTTALPMAGKTPQGRVAKPAKTPREDVPEEIMKKIYEQVKTPYKYGIIIKDESGKKVDCPSVFRHGEKWYMVYLIFDGKGYETAMAESGDLRNWKTLGRILTRKKEPTWDCKQVGGYIALQDHTWGGSYELRSYDGKYWLSYLAGALEGYETDPLAIGIAWTRRPAKPVEWNRIKENPVLHPHDADAREFEKKTLYKSNIIYD
ncbi:MAG: glycosylase, partial [Planctomycetota bacterium]